MQRALLGRPSWPPVASGDFVSYRSDDGKAEGWKSEVVAPGRRDPVSSYEDRSDPAPSGRADHGLGKVMPARLPIRG